MRDIDNSEKSLVAMALGAAGILFYLMLGVLYFASGLVMPYPWVFGMWAAWLAGLVALARVFRMFPRWTPAVAVAALIIWFVVVQTGSWLFGWTA